MKRILLLIIALWSIIGISYGQKIITLSASNTKITAGTVHYNGAALTGFVAPKADTNHAWNYSNLVFSDSTSLNYVANPFPTFSGTAIADLKKPELITSSSVLLTNYVYDEDTLAIFEAGNFVPAQNFSLANYFSNPKDSLYVNQQSDYSRTPVLNFPTSAKSVFNRNSIRTLNFTITVQTMNYKKAPATKSTYYSTKDTVMGWGTLRLPSPNKISIPYKVLLLKRKTVEIDSYFVNKKPFNIIYLKSLGIDQGKRTVDFTESFYRAGYPTPIMTIDYGTDTNYANPVAIFYATDSIKSKIDPEPEMLSDFKIFPNPVSISNSLYCRFTKNSSAYWKLMMINALGQEIMTGSIAGTGEITLNLPLKKVGCRGICFINIMDENGQKMASGKFSVND